ncbi:hypothetical protein HXX76_001778 [Chlamydomonas incerta]|uniref:Uncharacterized protein n=1 Tax=Chlamydomonas incerta TaxID=51695 RepID=A0A835TS24_CHLIN|nr:hypothetical protein HXX76_001778 [Chlamydomonas incerta]|eukprot:KAG2443420.1 hypothetical protein HXX76_001778 [Chlamydomonas incerta]
MLRSATQPGCRLPRKLQGAAPKLQLAGRRTSICFRRQLLPVPQPFQPTPDHAFGSRDIAVAAANSAAPPTDPSITFKKRFWTFIDVVAILGSVGGALAAILNLFSGTYVLFLPLVLPVVSLLSALQREGLIAEDNRRAYDTLRSSLARDSSGLLGEARAAIDDVRRELKGQNTTAARLSTIEARLSSLEGSILSVGRAAREAAAGLGMLPERLGGEQRAVLEGLVGAMRVELRRAAESLANNETTALARLDARLAAVEGSLSGLEVAQSEGMRRLGMSLNSALADAEASLQSSVRNEVARSMEPVRRLPQMLAAALPPALAAAEAVEASVNGGGGGGLIGSGGGGGAGAGVSAEQVQAIVGQEVEAAVGRILDFSADGFGRLGAVRPTPMDDEQWAALGRRLSRLERLVEGVPAAAEGSLVQNGGLAAAVAAAVRDAVAAQLAEAREEAAAAAAAAAAAEGERVRNDVLAAQVVLREGLDGLAASLAPLQLGVTEVAMAVAAVAEAQREAQAAAAQAAAAQLAAARQAGAEDGGDAGEGGMVAAAPLPRPPALAPAELSRLLDGVAAMAQLLRDVDARVGAVAAAVERLPSEVAAAASLAAAAPAGAGVASSGSAAQDGNGDGQAAAAAAAASAAAAAAAAAHQQQRELQAGIESMRAALAALAGQVGELASRAATAPAAAVAATPAAPATAATTAAAPSNISDVLSFEAGLVAGAVADAAAAAGAAGADGPAAASDAAAAVAGTAGRALPPSSGLSREQAYDMMLQVAEARRRSGSEAGSSSSSSTDAGSGSGSSRSGGARIEASATVVTAEAHLRIDGLPPFEQGSALEELSPLPPPQQELEATATAPVAPSQHSARLEQQQQQQQQEWQAAEAEQAAASAAAGYVDGGWQGQDAQQWQPPPPPPQQQQQQQQPQQQAYGEGGNEGYGYGYAESPQELGPSAGADEVAEAAAYANSQWASSPPPPPRPQQQPQAPPLTHPAAPAMQPPPQQPQQQQAFAQEQQPPFPPPSQPLQPTMQVQQQQPGPGVGGGVAPDYRMRPLEGLGPNEVISEGLRLLRLGREETRKGEDYGLADSLIQSAVAAFTAAADLAPGDAKALGNLGNALLARGELKAAYLEALRAGPPPATYAEAEAQRGAETAMTGEANALLTQAGLMFMKVLEMEGWSSRALVNWGRALVLRADLLAAAPEGAAPGSAAAAAVAQLYTSAINKFEGVLEGEPDMVPAKYRCALAMAGLSRTRPAASREALTLLADAINYLRDVLASPSPDAEALRGAAAAALASMEQQLFAARAGRAA